MALFRINGRRVRKIVSRSLAKEKDLQTLFENNLEEILNITFLASEYSTSFGGRIDTLGIDKNGSPVIIEYKRNHNDNVINQGLSYLRWLLDHKADFEMLCRKKNIDVDIEWDSPRVICIAESYNKFDLDTADLLPINIELLKFRIYDENILYVEPESYQKIKISTRGIVKKSSKTDKEQKELQKVYSIDDHLRGASETIKEIFSKLREMITSLDESIIEEPKAKYIAYKTSTNFVDIVMMTNKLKLYLNIKSGQLDDPFNIARDMTKPEPVGHWGNGDYEVVLERMEGIDKVFHLIKQSYELNR